MAGVKGKTGKGKRYGLRKNSSDVAAPNQWQATPQQERWIVYYLDPQSPTFGNPYTSALEAGYSDSYARVIATPSIGLQWVKEAQNIITLHPEHVSQALQELAMDRSEKSEVRLRALELIGKSKGMFIDRKQVLHGSFEDAIRQLK